jgi:hypothetical protein
MKKTHLFNTMILFSILSLIFSSSLSPVKAELIYGNIVSQYYNDPTTNIPTVNVSIDHIYTTASGGYDLNITHPEIANDSYIIYSSADDSVVKWGQMNLDGYNYNLEIPLSDVANGTYYLGFEFEDDVVNKTDDLFKSETTFTVIHSLQIIWSITPADDGNTVTIKTTLVTPTYSSLPAVDDTTVGQARYHLLKDSTEVKVGNLVYNSGSGDFEANDVSLVGLGSGNFSVYVDIEYLPLGKICSSIYGMNMNLHWFMRSAPFEDLLWISLIIIGAIAVVVIAVFIYAKKGSANVERRKKPVKENAPLEVIDIKKGNVQKIDTRKLPQKEKGKTKASKDLIFSVPQWEEEEFSAEIGEVTSSSNAPISKSIIYSMHCPKCNSWFEIDDFVEIECPKCSESLSLAMYCSKDDKWFDVPKLGDFKCPVCSGALKLSK